MCENHSSPGLNKTPNGCTRIAVRSYWFSVTNCSSFFPINRVSKAAQQVTNKHVKLTAERRRHSVPSVLRTPAAGYGGRWASRKVAHGPSNATIKYLAVYALIT